MISSQDEISRINILLKDLTISVMKMGGGERTNNRI